MRLVIPRPSSRNLWAVLAWLALGGWSCDRLSSDPFELSAPVPQPAAPPSAAKIAPNPRRDLARRLQTKFQPPPEPTALPSCQTLGTLPADSADARRLALVSVDVRIRPKQLIPSRVSERLETGETAATADLAEMTEAPGQRGSERWNQSRADSLPQPGALEWERLRDQRYLGIFYVSSYQGPSLIQRVGKLRREWLKGKLQARFVLLDTETRQALCAVDVSAQNDVTEAPIRSRLQAETRGRLERELGDTLRTQAQRLTTPATRTLDWPIVASTKRR